MKPRSKAACRFLVLPFAPGSGKMVTGQILHNLQLGFAPTTTLPPAFGLTLPWSGHFSRLGGVSLAKRQSFRMTLT
ncbi:MAG: hypothetical protein Q8P60_05055 [Pseudorhodobacter sp.]|nr:hypothetical protein [Pseudorhodobacter sp.]